MPPFPRLRPALPLCALLAGAIGSAAPLRAQNPAPTPTRDGAEPVHVNGTNLPPFLKVDGLYILNGNDEDMVRVRELSDTGWMRVQSKAGESWVNVHNLTIITPVSKEAAARTESRQRADYIRDGAQAISDAVDAYAAKNNLGPDAPFKWQDIRKFLKPGTPLYDSGGKDATGRPYLLGPKLEDHVKVSPETVKELSTTMPDADEYWGKFKP